MSRKKKRPLQVPDLPPEQGFAWLARQYHRQTTKDANHKKTGYVDEDRLRLEQLGAVAEAEVVAKHAAAGRPAITRATRYVMLADDLGQPIGITPA